MLVAAAALHIVQHMRRQRRLGPSFQRGAVNRPAGHDPRDPRAVDLVLEIAEMPHGLSSRLSL
jgi:hypothetical protein